MVLLPAVTPADECVIDQVNAAGTGLPGTGSLLLLDATAGSRRPAMSLSMEADFDINGVIARVSVRQWFRNSGSDWTEALYVFPLPDGAAVDTLRVEVDGRTIVGEIREKAQARAEYTMARDAGQVAGLVEVADRNLFSTAVANVPPLAEVLVEIEYQQTLAWSGREYRLRFPLAFTPRYCSGNATAGIRPAGMRAASTDEAGIGRTDPAGRLSGVRLTAHIVPGFPVDGLASAYHDIAVIPSAEGYAVTLIGDTVPADRDFELTWAPIAGAQTEAAIFTERMDGEDYVLLMLMPPHPGDGPAATGSRAREVIFVLDTSGSMAGPALRQARQALSLALARLTELDRFNVIAFNTVARKLFESSRPADARQVGFAQSAVLGLDAGGGTEMQAALESALSGPAQPGRLRQVVFITDGAVGDEASLLSLIEKRLGDARLFPVGIGPAPNAGFLRHVATAGRGTATLIGSTQQVRERMSALFTTLERPALTDIAIAWPGGAAETWPARIPDLYAGEPIVLAARTRFDGGMVTVTGRMGGEHWVRQLVLPAATHHPGIARQWARRKIRGIEDLARSGFPGEDIRTQATEVALQFGLVTRYTSLVAIDRTPVRAPGASTGRTNTSATTPAGRSVRLPSTDAGSGRLILFGALALLLAMLIWPWPGSRLAALWRTE
jgi:Ca-activated chloride channel family protein